MSDSDYEDELPSISVLSQDKVMSNWSMPSAEKLATQRAREEQCEKELQRLHEETAETSLAAMRCDSSGSEGESALAAAVRELQVQQTINSVPDSTQLVSALIQRLEAYDTRLLEQYLEVLQSNNQTLITNVTDEILGSVCGVIWHDENSWGDAEIKVVGSWLCAVSVAVGGTTRPLHALLDERASSTHVQVTSWDDHPDLTLQEVSPRLCASWCGLGPAQRELAVRAAGRVLALCPRDCDEDRLAARRLLDAMKQPQSLKDKNRPEIQELHVGVTKLQVLFYDTHPVHL